MVPGFLENLLESGNLFCSATATTKTALGIIQLWFNYFRGILAYTLPGRLSKEMPLLLVHSLLTPFLCMGTNNLLIFRHPSKKLCHLTHTSQPNHPAFEVPIHYQISRNFCFNLGFNSGIRELIDAQFYGSFHMCKVKTYRLKNFAQFCQVSCQANVDKRKAPCSNLLPLAVASLDNHLVLLACCNCWPFVFIVVWCIARQADRNGETVKHFHICIKVLSQFRTPYCTNLVQYSKRPKGSGAHDNAQIPNLQFSLPTSAPENCLPITLQPSVAISTCRKTCLSQFVLLQYKAKPYLGFQNLGCHCKILGCHFDTQKDLKKHWVQHCIQLTIAKMKNFPKQQ